MINSIYTLLGLDPAVLNLSDDVVFCVSSLILLFCLGYVFNFFQILMERLTARK